MGKIEAANLKECKSECTALDEGTDGKCKGFQLTGTEGKGLKCKPFRYAKGASFAKKLLTSKTGTKTYILE